MIASPAEASSQTASSTEFASAHRVRKADWADVRVGRRPIAVGAIAEGLGGRRQLHVRLDADCRLVIHLRTGIRIGVSGVLLPAMSSKSGLQEVAPQCLTYVATP